MTRSKRTIAERVLSEPEAVAFMTIGELAGLCGVNESTVHRFAVGLGLNGYPALTALCRAQVREQAQLVRRFEQLSSEVDPDRNPSVSIIRQTGELDRKNILRSVSLLDEQHWSDAVEALSRSRSIYVMGMRQTFSVAHLLSYLLQLVRGGVENLGVSDGTLIDRIRDIGSNDCFVAVSVYPYARETLTATRFAAKRGARTIVLTDNPASPLVPYSTVPIYCETRGSSILKSMTAFTSVVQGLASEVALRRGVSTRSALLLGDELLDWFETYHNPADAADPPASKNSRRAVDDS